MTDQEACGLTGLEQVEVSTKECCNLLDSTRWGRDFDWEWLEKLSEYVRVYRTGPKKCLSAEGSSEAYLGLIAKGSVSVQKRDEKGNQKSIAILGRGQSFGEMSLLDGYPRSAAIVTELPVLLLVLTQERFERMLRLSPQLGIKVMRKICNQLSSRLRQTSGQLVDYLDD